MDMFRKAMTVRLLSHHDKYLLADEDEKSVSQERDGSSERAMWHVELVRGSNLIRLKSCYGKYLTASDAWQYFGMLGKKVTQTYTRKPDSSTEWEPIREGVQVKLKSRYGYYLRANDGLWPLPWRNSVSHNIPRRSLTKDWIFWGVEVVERLEESEMAESIVIRRSHPISRSSSSSSASDLYLSAHASSNMSPRTSQENSPNMSPTMPPPKETLFLSPKFFPNISSKMAPKMSLNLSSNTSPIISISPITSSGVSLRQQNKEGFSKSPVPAKSEGRLIWYKVAGENFAEMDETMSEGSSFHFRGSEVEELKVKLAKETGLGDEEFIVCSRNPFNGRLYPLKLDLPPNHSPMSLFVVPSSSEVAKEIASWDSTLGLSPELR